MTPEELAKAMADHPPQHFRDRLTAVLAEGEARRLTARGDRERLVERARRDGFLRAPGEHPLT